MAKISMNEARFLDDYVQKWAYGRELNPEFLVTLQTLVTTATCALLDRRDAEQRKAEKVINNDAQ